MLHFFLFLGNVQTCDHKFCDCPYSDPNECIKTIDPNGTTTELYSPSSPAPASSYTASPVPTNSAPANPASPAPASPAA